MTTHVQSMLDVIERSYDERVTLDTLGEILNRQSKYLGRLFRKKSA